MDLEVISALAAAGVAAIGIPAALLVGRWQLRGAMATARAGTHAAEEAARAGVAQAEASYRAALDAVRASATEAHAQWIRGVRREAYSNFLLSSYQVTAASHQMFEDCEKGVFSHLEEHRAAVKDSMTKLRGAALVVTLEGPDLIAIFAEAMVRDTESVVREDTGMTYLLEARHKLEAAAEQHAGASNLLEALKRYEQARYYGFEIVDKDEAWARVEQFMYRSDLEADCVTANTRLASSGLAPESERKREVLERLLQHRKAFVTEARSLLDKSE